MRTLSENEKIIDSVTTTSIDALMAENHFEYIDILKMDIEKSFEERLAEINDKIKDAEENFGET